MQNNSATLENIDHNQGSQQKPMIKQGSYQSNDSDGLRNVTSTDNVDNMQLMMMSNNQAVQQEKHIHIYCGIRINVISMMNDSSLDSSPITFFLTPSR